MANNGFIKLDRNTLKHFIKENDWLGGYAKLFLFLLVEVAFKDYEYSKINKGQFTTTVEYLAENIGISTRQVANILKTFESFGLIEKRNMGDHLKITLKNYNELVDTKVVETKSKKTKKDKPTEKIPDF